MSDTMPESMFEVKVGDYVERLRIAESVKDGERTFYGGMEIIPTDDKYRLRGIDGEERVPIARNNLEVETLVEMFDHKLKTALSDL